jgi:predicted metal-dependent hydrolase
LEIDIYYLEFNMDYPIRIEKSRRRSLALFITPDRTVLVKAPLLTPKFIIDQFVAKHTDWIEKRLAKLQSVPLRGTRQYTDGETLLFLGKQYRIRTGPFTNIAFRGDALLFPKALQFRAEKELHTWYKKMAENFITQQVEKFAREMEAEYKEITFSDTKSRWGSCSHDNRLQFNWRLVMAPVLVVNYVIVHELAHTSEKNHSRDFWRRVEKYNPSYRQSRKWLSESGHTLVF